MSARPVTLAVLNAMAMVLMLAQPWMSAPAHALTVEQDRVVRQADRVRERLATINANDLDDDALERFGSLVSAARGMTFNSVGKQCDGFANDQTSISVIMGPYGSAKTTGGGFRKVLNSALWQPVGPDGAKRVKWAFFRDTYGHLETNIMADWFMWFPRTEKNFSLRNNRHQLRLDIPLKNGAVQVLLLDILFRACEGKSAEELAKGLSLTGAWLNEMDTLHKDLFTYIFPRCGRYRTPGTPLGGWSGLIGDMNAPAEDNWVYDFAVNKNIGLTADELAGYQKQFGPNFGLKFWRQPGGLDPNAENLANLPDGYYERLQIGMAGQDVRRFVHNDFGAVSSGSPVYSQWRDERHCLDSIAPDKALAIHFGIDGGNTPAVVMLQKTLTGQIRQIDECVIYKPGKKDQLERTGPYEFGVYVGEYWNEHYGTFKLGETHWADPAAWEGGAHRHVEDKVWIEKFREGFNATVGQKIRIKPAPVKGNLITPRLEAVRSVLRDDPTGQPRYVVSAKCKVTREGFNRGYVNVRVEYSTGGGRWKDEPLKNEFSHVHDGLQYGILGLTKFEGWQDQIDSSARRATKVKVRHGSGFFSGMGVG
jgi:hypothetical protein